MYHLHIDLMNQIQPLLNWLCQLSRVSITGQLKVTQSLPMIHYDVYRHTAMQEKH